MLYDSFITNVIESSIEDNLFKTFDTSMVIRYHKANDAKNLASSLAELYNYDLWKESAMTSLESLSLAKYMLKSYQF